VVKYAIGAGFAVPDMRMPDLMASSGIPLDVEFGRQAGKQP
jgi:hypothetical protein